MTVNKVAKWMQMLTLCIRLSKPVMALKNTKKVKTKGIYTENRGYCGCGQENFW